MDTPLQNHTTSPTTVFIASTTKGWTIVSENGIKISGYYKSSKQAKEAVKNLVEDSNFEIVTNTTGIF